MPLINEIDKAAQRRSVTILKDVRRKKRREKATPKPKITICFDCQNFTGNKGRFWKRFCKAAPQEKTIDYVTGENAFSGTNDMGGAYTTEQKYQHCHYLNHGKCQNFQTIEKRKKEV